MSDARTISRILTRATGAAFVVAIGATDASAQTAAPVHHHHHHEGHAPGPVTHAATHTAQHPSTHVPAHHAAHRATRPDAHAVPAHTLPAHPTAHHAAEHHAGVHHVGPHGGARAVERAPGRAIAHVAPVVPVPAPAPLAAPPPPDKGSNTGLPLPRFAAMRADEVNMRAGPGDRYPITWVYHRRGLPVEIEREFDVWRLVEDSDGQKGWVHQATLVGQRTFVIPGLPPEGASAAPGQAGEKTSDVIGRADARIVARVADEQDARALPGVTLMFARADAQSPVVAALRPGTVGTLKLCPPSSDAGAGWCRVVVKGYGGWLPRRVLWGLLPDETITTP